MLISYLLYFYWWCPGDGILSFLVDEYDGCMQEALRGFYDGMSTVQKSLCACCAFIGRSMIQSQIVCEVNTYADTE